VRKRKRGREEREREDKKLNNNSILRNGEERENSHLSIQSQIGLVEHIPIPYKFINNFLKGEWSYRQFVEKKILSGKSKTSY
jgi:hypothetical protein